MAKNLKLHIKNTQIAEAINLGGLKSKLAKKKLEESSEKSTPLSKPILPSAEGKIEEGDSQKEEAPRIRARSKSAFAEPPPEEIISKEIVEQENENVQVREPVTKESSFLKEEDLPKTKSSAQLRREIFGDEEISPPKSSKHIERENVSPPVALEASQIETVSHTTPSTEGTEEQQIAVKQPTTTIPPSSPTASVEKTTVPSPFASSKLGPTGRHIKDYYKPKPVVQPPRGRVVPGALPAPPAGKPGEQTAEDKLQGKFAKAKPPAPKEISLTDLDQIGKGIKTTKIKEFRDIKPPRRVETKRFDARDKQGLRTSDEDLLRRRRKGKQPKFIQEDLTIRPTSLKVHLPISIKDLASEMKLKSSQLISKLFMQGLVVTLNDLLEDETTIQLLGHEFGCEIAIDTTEEKRIRITDRSIKDELLETDQEQLIFRPPVVAFMGHVDHGKTSLIDAIRSSNRAAGEAGAITQHIGAFKCTTPIGDIAILDTPGHEAFSSMRARGAEVTDIVVLVVAGDEGLKQQTLEAIQHAKAAHVIIVVAINKCDKPNYNPETVYRQLAEAELLPEVWGGQTLTVNCSAVTKQGIPELLETLALQAEILELRANPNARARGTVLESEMHKGMGSVATVLVQNGTLRKGDSLVFGQMFGRVKTMHDEHRRELQEAGPSTPVEITGLSGLPEAGQEFIVVKNEKEAREIANARSEGMKQSNFLLQHKKKISMENLLQQASATSKKTLNIILRTDVQGSLEALKVALMKIESDKVDVNIIFTGVGEISESDVQLAAASKAIIIGFHTQIESHAEPLVKQLGVHVHLHSIIYHAVDDVKAVMGGLLEKIAQETEKGKAIVKAVFKSSQTGLIAGCQVTEGSIHRNHHIRVRRDDKIVWTGTISSLKRVKEDVREVQKGIECGILLNNFSDFKENDILEAYEITYITQEL